MTRPDWLDSRTAQDVAALFSSHGVPEGVLVIPTTGGDEAIFLVDSSRAAAMHEAALTAALMDRLCRKVWITTDASAWREMPIALTAPEEGTAQ